LIVAEFASLQQRRMAEADPYAATGVFRQITVQPFKKVMPA